MQIPLPYTADEGDDDVTIPIDTVTWERNDPDSERDVYLWEVASSPDIRARQFLTESLSSHYLETVKKNLDEKYFGDNLATSAFMHGISAWLSCYRLDIMLHRHAKNAPKSEVRGLT